MMLAPCEAQDLILFEVTLEPLFSCSTITELLDNSLLTSYRMSPFADYRWKYSCATVVADFFDSKISIFLLLIITCVDL
jgi:hypothetical protein